MPSKSEVDRSKGERQRGTTFAKGGHTRLMFGKQAAGPAKSGQTGKNQTPAPGAKAARGGGHAPVPGKSLTAKPGRSGPR